MMSTIFEGDRTVTLPYEVARLATQLVKRGQSRLTDTHQPALQRNFVHVELFHKAQFVVHVLQ